MSIYRLYFTDSSSATHSSHGSHGSSNAVHNSHSSHSNVAHMNVNTGAKHINNAGGSIPGTSEIPKIQKPVSDKFVKSIPKVKSVVSLALTPGETNVSE